MLKKIIDRRMIGYTFATLSIHALAAKVTEPATVAIVVPAAFSTLVILFATLAGANAAQGVAEKFANKNKPEGEA